MANTIIFLICVILPSILFGYCVRWMLEEQTIAKQIKTNKQENILPPLN
jgi:hypothetical protein